MMQPTTSNEDQGSSPHYFQQQQNRSISQTLKHWYHSLQRHPSRLALVVFIVFYAVIVFRHTMIRSLPSWYTAQQQTSLNHRNGNVLKKTQHEKTNRNDFHHYHHPHRDALLDIEEGSNDNDNAATVSEDGDMRKIRNTKKKKKGSEEADEIGPREGNGEDDGKDSSSFSLRRKKSSADDTDDSSRVAELTSEPADSSSTTDSVATSARKKKNDAEDTSSSEKEGEEHGDKGGGGKSGRSTDTSDDVYSTNRNEQEDDSAPPPPPRHRHRRLHTSEEELQLLWNQIHRLESKDKLDEVRIRLEELQEKREERERLRSEINFGSEEEEHREREREWMRAKWQAMGRRQNHWEEQNLRKEEASFKQLEDANNNNHNNYDDGNFAGRNEVADSSSMSSQQHGHHRFCEQMPGHGSFLPYHEQLSHLQQTDYAYATFVTSSEFVQAAAVLMYSISISHSQYARVICVTAEVTDRDRERLSIFGQIVEIERVPPPAYIENKRYRETFTKLRLWQLVMYTKIVYIDTDVVVIRNMDTLFDMPEWSVPLDAEFDRYSTGMMVLVPSLATYDAMMKKLKTTQVSMELPDLLFLNEFFSQRSTEDVPKRKSSVSWYDSQQSSKIQLPKISIIPRWYQVYQEEFGSEYSTYLTNRHQKITIYDERIHGIHYPGESKPWLRFYEKSKKYAQYVCHWATGGAVEKFQYEPQFLWFVIWSRMKESLTSAQPSLLFDYERLPVILLSAYVQKAKEDEEEEKKNRWGGNSYQYSSYGDKSGNNRYEKKKYVWKNGQWQIEYEGAGKQSDDKDGGTSGVVAGSPLSDAQLESAWQQLSFCGVRLQVPLRISSSSVLLLRNFGRNNKNHSSSSFLSSLLYGEKQQQRMEGGGEEGGTPSNDDGDTSNNTNTKNNSEKNKKVGESSDTSFSTHLHRMNKRYVTAATSYADEEGGEENGATNNDGNSEVEAKKRKERKKRLTDLLLKDEEEVKRQEGEASRSEKKNQKKVVLKGDGTPFRNYVTDFDKFRKKMHHSEVKVVGFDDGENDDGIEQAKPARKKKDSEEVLLVGESILTAAGKKRKRNSADDDGDESRSDTKKIVVDQKNKKKIVVDDNDVGEEKEEQSVARKKKKNANAAKKDENKKAEEKSKIDDQKQQEKENNNLSARKSKKEGERTAEKKTFQRKKKKKMAEDENEAIDHDDDQTSTTAAGKKKLEKINDDEHKEEKSSNKKINNKMQSKNKGGNGGAELDDAETEDNSRSDEKRRKAGEGEKSKNENDSTTLNQNSADDDSESEKKDPRAVEKELLYQRRKKFQKQDRRKDAVGENEKSKIAKNEKEKENPTGSEDEQKETTKTKENLNATTNEDEEKKENNKGKKIKGEDEDVVSSTPEVEIGVLDFSRVDPFVFQMPQIWRGHPETDSLEPYIWFVNWCTKTKLHPASTSSCGKPSFVSQYSGGVCRTNFDESLTQHVIWNVPTLLLSSAARQSRNYEKYQQKKNEKEKETLPSTASAAGAGSSGDQKGTTDDDVKNEKNKIILPTTEETQQSATVPSSSSSSSFLPSHCRFPSYWQKEGGKYLPLCQQLVSGIVFRSRVVLDEPVKRSKWMEVRVRCDWDLPMDEVFLDPLEGEETKKKNVENNECGTRRCSLEKAGILDENAVLKRGSGKKSRGDDDDEKATIEKTTPEADPKSAKTLKKSKKNQDDEGKKADTVLLKRKPIYGQWRKRMHNNSTRQKLEEVNQNKNENKKVQSFVEVLTPFPPHDRLYRINLKSRCACWNGCSLSHALNISFQLWKQEISSSGEKILVEECQGETYDEKKEAKDSENDKDAKREKKKETAPNKKKEKDGAEEEASTPPPTTVVQRKGEKEKDDDDDDGEKSERGEKKQKERKGGEVYEKAASSQHVYRSSFCRTLSQLKSYPKCWGRIHDFTEGVYCNCSTHMGGSDLNIPSRENCFAEAKKAGANVVNYYKPPSSHDEKTDDKKDDSLMKKKKESEEGITASGSSHSDVVAAANERNEKHSRRRKEDDNNKKEEESTKRSKFEDEEEGPEGKREKKTKKKNNKQLYSNADTFQGGCYYKKCSLLDVAIGKPSLTKMVPSDAEEEKQKQTKKKKKEETKDEEANKGEEEVLKKQSLGYEVWVLNPLCQ